MTALKSVQLASALAVNAPGVTAAQALGAGRYGGKYALSVTANPLGASLGVAIETADAVEGPWTPVCTALPSTGVETQALEALGCKLFLRARYDVGGGLVTFSLGGLSDQTYCIPADLTTLSLPGGMLSNIPLADQQLACVAATDEAVSYLGVSYDLPLVSWGNALRMHCANMAAYHVMKRRGYSVDNDPLIRTGYTDAIEWLKGFARSDPSIVDTTPAPVGGGGGSPYVVSQPPRGWSRYF